MGPILRCLASVIPPRFSPHDRTPPLITPAVAWLSLLASVLYTFGVLFLKRSTQWKPDSWQIAFVCNMVAAVTFFPLFALGGTIPSFGLLWQPALVAMLFIGGQVFSILALTRGDVSVATPMLGLKILFVTGFAFAISGDPISPQLWLAAALATAAVALLGTSGSGGSHRRVGYTAGCSILAAGSYAMFDVLVQLWSPDWGVGRFVPLSIMMAVVFSFALVPLFHGSLRQIDRPAWFWILGGSLLIGIQSVIFTSTIATWGHAALANVVYSSRGLWSVILIAVVGHWFSKSERSLGPRILLLRLAGAGLLSVAVFLIV